ncbi:MAG TPA: substrate-binding domain-containing protein, partial [Flavobacterium sp.]|nr:substrate-binding domain-containing protein [Flavobacterium sp.]
MKRFFRIFVFVCILAIGLIFSCKKDTGTATEVEQTSTSGNGQILVDNTVQPIIEDVIAVFHSVYERANLTQINKTETEIINALMQDSARVAVLPRLLTEQEEAVFKRKNITPHITPFAVDAIAFIANGAAQDTVINLEEVLKVLRGESGEKSLKLVFDNPGSSTIQYLLKIAGVKQVPSQNVFALKTNEEVIKYVHDNPNTIGIVGVNWLVQPPPALADYVENLTVLAVDNVKIDGKEKKYYKP